MTSFDQQILQEINSSDRSYHEKALKELYSKFYKSVERFILSKGGNTEDAKDIFQDSLIIFYQSIRKNKFRSESSIKTYLFGICKNIWLSKIKSSSKEKLVFSNLEHNLFTGYDEDNLVGQEDKEALVKELLHALNEPCKQILTYHYFERLSMKEITHLTGYANENVAKSKKYKCLQKLIKLALKHPLLQGKKVY